MSLDTAETTAIKSPGCGPARAEKAGAMGGFGEKLTRERELRGVSLREIAEGTKISIRFLQALEEDKVEALPGGLFPRAFVKQYALFLGLDADRAVADFVAAHGDLAPERKLVAPPPVERRSPVSLGHLFLGAVAVVAIALTLRRGGPSAQRPQPSPTPLAAPVVLPTDRVLPGAALAPASAGDGLVLTLTAQADCWVEVRADGATVVNRVLAQGESQTFEARGELVLSVGNAGGVSIKVNDKPALPLGRSGEVRKNIVITRRNLPDLVGGQSGAATTDGRSG
jgi:cytoskeleton protein RodZ